MGQQWRAYHEATKHTPERLRRAAYSLDWDNMPNPYRHYDGVPLLDLPADPPAPEISAWDVLRGHVGNPSPLQGPELLSALLFYSASISATKVAPGTGHRYALRVNPSSGNLHPTEFHFATRGLPGWPDGIYHYRPSQHVVEQRGTGDFGLGGTLVFLLTSIPWREAWKYRDRAYRYCLHDIGHAWQSLELAGRAIGYACQTEGSFDDASLAAKFSLAPDEWPQLLVRFEIAPSALLSEPSFVCGGAPNRLSASSVVPELIEQIHAATCGVGPSWLRRWAPLDGSSIGGRPFGETVRGRRSALDFTGGDASMTMAQLMALLTLVWEPDLTLYLYVHRVSGLLPGLYRYQQDLERLQEGDQRVAAAGLSLGQDLAGNSCLTLSMVADLDGVTARYGDRGYRYAHFEAGALGQRLYVGAEALGLRATGIGAFYDDRVHAYLGLTKGQVIYHFAIGYAVPDPRLQG